ncbi:hypothetical protein HHI36_015479 [Cryptolaemus montrouzieri]|uniref:DALR anticodon binding domain-containing protein n=1 Tax=Cryptolaemus montrouzieri TaxID=559131 RepID=A0ABD2N5S6_9CUCU
MDQNEENNTNIYVLDNILYDIHLYIRVPVDESNIIRIHSKKLETLGEISFPLNIKNWYRLIDIKVHNAKTILEYASSDVPEQLGESNNAMNIEKLRKESEKWFIKLNRASLDKDSVHIYLERSISFKETIKQSLKLGQEYGAVHRICRLKADINIEEYSDINTNEMTLTNLRMLILQKVIKNLTQFQLNCNNKTEKLVSFNLSVQKRNENEYLCGSVVDTNGTKDVSTLAGDLYKKRATDMRLMAEHKYGLRTKSSESWNQYFKKLGEAAVTVELLQNKPHKNIKITLNDTSSANKGASFIFYNCARLSTLFKEFDKRVVNQVYPELVPLDNIDFSLLNQPEEWELLYVYIMQYPQLIKTCIKDVEKGIANPHYLISFLSNLCSIFSVYYRRIRILVAPKPHLIPTLHARIYLLKSLEQIFHKTLQLLDIDPIKEM